MKDEARCFVFSLYTGFPGRIRTRRDRGDPGRHTNVIFMNLTRNVHKNEISSEMDFAINELYQR